MTTDKISEHIWRVRSKLTEIDYRGDNLCEARSSEILSQVPQDPHGTKPITYLATHRLGTYVPVLPTSPSRLGISSAEIETGISLLAWNPCFERHCFVGYRIRSPVLYQWMFLEATQGHLHF